MESTIFYRSSIKWFSHSSGRYASKHDALRAHLNYIEKSKDFRFAIGDINKIMNNSKQADKRVNSRIAFSFVFALPNSLNYQQVKLWMEQIRYVIARFNNMDPSNIYLGFHDSQGISQQGNKHVHIVGANINKDGKSITLGRGKDEPQKLNKELEKLIKDHGYVIKKNDGEGIGHIGTRMRYDRELKNEYLDILRTKMELQKELQKTREQNQRLSMKQEIKTGTVNIQQSKGVTTSQVNIKSQQTEQQKSIHQPAHITPPTPSSANQKPHRTSQTPLSQTGTSYQKPQQQAYQKPATLPQTKKEPDEKVKKLLERQQMIHESIQQLMKEQEKKKQQIVKNTNPIEAVKEVQKTQKLNITTEQKEIKQEIKGEYKEIVREEKLEIRKEKKSIEQVRKEIWEQVLNDEERKYVLEYLRRQKKKQEQNRKQYKEQHNSVEPDISFKKPFT